MKPFQENSVPNFALVVYLPYMLWYNEDGNTIYNA